jgi:hypothetical protein
MRVKGNTNTVLVGKPEGKTQLGRPTLRWEGNIKMDPREILWGDMDCFFWLRIETSGELVGTR